MGEGGGIAEQIDLFQVLDVAWEAHKKDTLRYSYNSYLQINFFFLAQILP